jgi:hypothetical protein
LPQFARGPRMVLENGKVPDRREQLAGLFVVLGATVVFGPAVWLFVRWREAVARDPASAWGAPWLADRLSAHPYLTAGALLLGLAFSSGLVMLILVGLAKRLASRLTAGARSGRRSMRG